MEDNMKETWEALHSNNKYEISNLGNIRKYGKRKNIKVSLVYNPNRAVVSLEDAYGFQRVQYYSRLYIAHKFKLNKKDPHWIATFKDGNPHNISLDNLEISTPSRRASQFCRFYPVETKKDIVLNSSPSKDAYYAEKYGVKPTACCRIRSMFRIIEGRLVKTRRKGFDKLNQFEKEGLVLVGGRYVTPPKQ
jgi:hypothetical protein